MTLRWPAFLDRIYKQRGHATDNNRANSPFNPLTATPTDAYARSTLRNHEPSFIVAATPFLGTGFSVTSRSLNPIQDSMSYIRALIPESPGVHATLNDRSTADKTWRWFLGLDDFEYFDQVVRVMTLYCKHFKASTTLGLCSPVGHTAGQTVATKVAKRPTPTTRFASINHTFRIHSRNNQLPAADNSDAAIAVINYDQFTDNIWTHVDNSTSETHVTAGTARLRGPYFYKLPLVKRGDSVVPSAAYSSIITDYYHVQTIRS